MLSHVSSPSSASDTCTNIVCQGSSVPKSKSSHLPALNHLPVSSYALAAERRFVPVDRNWNLVCKETYPRRPPLASHPGTICLFVFFYKLSRPISPRIFEHPSLNFPRQRVHYPRLFIILPLLKVLLLPRLPRARKPVLLECECLSTGLESKLPLSVPHISPVGSPPFTSTVSKRHLQDAKAIQGRA
nr:hypothetical protein FVER53263_20813 [Fusarium verticillioides]